MPKYFDIHSHLNFDDFALDWDEVIARMRETGTYTIVVGTNYEDSKVAVELAEKYPEIYACVGVHPVDDKNAVFEKEKFEELIKHSKVVAIGECGLDFHHAKKSEDYERQKELFLAQIDFALKYDKPLMIHARDAYQEILEVFESLSCPTAKLRGNVHFFAGDWEIAQRFFALNFTVSFTGVITLTSDYDEVVSRAPLDKILSETDAPLVAPVPYRGKRNEPAYVSEVVKKIAEVRGEPFELVRETLVNNALSMIG